jgi:hypothetical protein
MRRKVMSDECSSVAESQIPLVGWGAISFCTAVSYLIYTEKESFWLLNGKDWGSWANRQV